MTRNDILAKLNGYGKGKFISAQCTYNLADEMGKRLVKNAIANGQTIPTVEKTTTMVVMSGTDYDNRKEVKIARENGHLPQNNAGLKWGEWIKGLEGYILKHTNKKGEYNEYVRLYPTYNANHRMNAKTEYRVDGVITEKAELKKLGLFNDSFFNPLGTDEEYQMLDFLLLKEKSTTPLDNDEQKELDDLRFKLMPQVMSVNIANVDSLG